MNQPPKKLHRDLPCTHRFCHRHEIESEKPIGFPWASGALIYLPGHGPNPRNLEAVALEKRRKELIKKLFHAPLIEPVCPKIIKNILAEKSKRFWIKDEIAYMSNLYIQAGTDDVRKFIENWKNNRKSSKPGSETTIESTKSETKETSWTDLQEDYELVDEGSEGYETIVPQETEVDVLEEVIGEEEEETGVEEGETDKK